MPYLFSVPYMFVSFDPFQSAYFLKAMSTTEAHTFYLLGLVVIAFVVLSPQSNCQNDKVTNSNYQPNPL